MYACQLNRYDGAMEAGAEDPGRGERTPRGQGELLRGRLIEAALAMVDEGLVQGTSIRAVTRRAGVSPTAFYLHFESREELMAACVERCFVAFRDAIREAAAAEQDPRARLLAAGVAYIRFAEEWPERYGLIFGAGPGGGSTGGIELSEKPPAADDAFGDLVGRILEYLPPADPRREEADTLAKGIWSGLHGFVTLRHLRPGIEWPDDEDFARRLASAWLDRGDT